MSSNLIFGKVVNMQLAATPSNGSYLVAYDIDGFIKQKNDQGIISRIGGLSNTIVDNDNFTTDIRVSLPDGESFGKYVNGDIILSNNKTAIEVIQMSMVKPLPPTIILNSPTIIEFNQTSIVNILNFSYSTNSIDISGNHATVSSVLLEYKRGNENTWVTLTNDDNILTYSHIINSVFTTNSFDYRLTVNDSHGGVNSATQSITPVSYISPTISIEVLSVTHSTPEEHLKREKGNIESNINLTIDTNGPFLELSSYQLQYQLNGGSVWINIGDLVSISGSTISTTILHSGDLILVGASSIGYRVLVTDTTSVKTSDIVTVNFSNLIFYGVSSSPSLSASEIRSLSNRIFEEDSNSFIISTGTEFKNFIFAIPSNISLQSVIDEDTGVNYTDIYTNSVVNILDYGNMSTPYKLYKMSLGIPYYPSEHRHNIITQRNVSNVVDTVMMATYISIEVLAVTHSTPETNIKRESGNIVSNINIEITKNDPLIELISYQLQYKTNGTWINIDTSVSITGSTVITTILHNDNTLVNSNSISYRVLVTDTTNQIKISNVVTVNFNNLIFYGVSYTPPLATDVRNLPNRIFVDENIFTIFTGIEFKNFSFAIPDYISLLSIIDEDTGVNYTDIYTNTLIDVLDYGNTTISYKLHKMSLGIPYYPNGHRHVVLLN